MKKTSNLIWGLLFILIGLSIGLNTLDLVSFNIFFDGWWALIIIIPCLIGLINNEDKTGDIIGLLIGVALLLNAQGIISFDIIWKLAAPLILVIIGLSIILKDNKDSKTNVVIKKINSNDNEKTSVCSAFSSQNIKLNKEKINNLELNAIFGGIEYDLRNGVIKEDIVINATAIFGGIDIIVPDDVNVKIKSTSIFGGASNKKQLMDDKEKKHTIYINASCVFGGVDIKWHLFKK